MKDLAIAIAIFMIILFAGIDYLGIFGIKEQVPSEVSSAYNSTFESIKQAQEKVSEKIEEMGQAGSLWEQFKESIGLSFGVIHYIGISLWSIFVSIPQSFFGFVNFITSKLGINPAITAVITSIVTVITITKAISWLTGRKT